jgi:HK97 family phage portal protein
VRLHPRRFRRESPPDEARALTRDSLPAIMLPDGGTDEAPGIRAARQIADCYACLRALADGAALVPLGLYERQGPRSVKIESGSTVSLFRRPAPAIPAPAFIGETVATLAAHGEAFWGKYKVAGETIAVGLLNPDRVEVKLVAGSPVYTYTHPDGHVDSNLTADAVLHIRGALTVDGIRGLSPIRSCRDTLSLARSLTRSASSLWQNSAKPFGVLTVPAGGGGEDDQAESLKKAWEARHEGPKNQGRIAVLTGEVKFTQTTLSAADAEWVATREISGAEMARIFRVPGWVIGVKTGDSLTYSNTAEQMSAFARFALAPLLAYVESAVSEDDDLCPGEQFARFDLSELTRGDPGQRADRNQKALHPTQGWESRDEVREREGLPPEEGPEE